MNRLRMTSLAIVAAALLAPSAASAANLTIQDLSPGGITFNASQFDVSTFTLNGSTPVNGTLTVADGSYNFFGQFITNGLVPPLSGAAAFGVNGGTANAILTFNYSQSGSTATLTGNFSSGGNLAIPSGAVSVAPGGSFNFTNTNITASASSAAPVVPEPASLVLLGSGLAGLAMKARRRKQANSPASA